MDAKKVKKDKALNPNKVRTIYLWNIIFLSLLVIVSLLFALLVYFRLRTKGTDGIRTLYSDQQIRMIKSEAANREHQIMLAKMRSSLESGEGTTLMIREMFSDQMVVLSEGKYYFYPISDDVEKNRIPSGLLTCEDGRKVEYRGTYPSMTLVHGALISDDNGRIDWDRLLQNNIDELTIRAGRLEAKKFTEDLQFERNCSEALKKDMPFMMSLEVDSPADEDVVSKTAEKIYDMVSQSGLMEKSAKNNGAESDTAESKEESGTGVSEEKSGAGKSEEKSGTGVSEEKSDAGEPKEESGAGEPKTGSVKGEPQGESPVGETKEGSGAGGPKAESVKGEPGSDSADKAPGSSGTETGADEKLAVKEAAAKDDANPTVVLKIRNVEKISENDRDRDLWTETVSSLCKKLEEKGLRVIVGGSNQTFAAQIDISRISQYNRWLVDNELTIVFPYSVFCWEFSRAGRLNGVPGEASLYAKMLVEGQW